MGKSIQITSTVSRVGILRSTVQFFSLSRNKPYTTYTLKFGISIQKYVHVGGTVSRRLRFKIATRRSMIVQTISI